MLFHSFRSTENFYTYRVIYFTNTIKDDEDKEEKHYIDVRHCFCIPSAHSLLEEINNCIKKLV